MCAICGIVNFNETDPVDPAVIERMTDALAHCGIFLNGRVGLGHRRLSIIDLSGARQPLSIDGVGLNPEVLSC